MAGRMDAQNSPCGAPFPGPLKQLASTVWSPQHPQDIVSRARRHGSRSPRDPCDGIALFRRNPLPSALGHQHPLLTSIMLQEPLQGCTRRASHARHSAPPPEVSLVTTASAGGGLGLVTWQYRVGMAPNTSKMGVVAGSTSLHLEGDSVKGAIKLSPSTSPISTLGTPLTC